MDEKDTKNYLAKVIKQDKEGNNIIQLFELSMDKNALEYSESKIEPLLWDVAKKEFNIVGMLT